MFFTSCIYSGVGVSFWWAGPILYVYCYTYIYSPEYASMYVHPAYHGLICSLMGEIKCGTRACPDVLVLTQERTGHTSDR